VKTSQWLGAVALMALSFLLGRMSNGTAVKAAPDNVQADVRQIGPETSLILTYPDLKKIYVYAKPFIGGPDQACSYSFTLGDAGKPVKREACAPPD